MSKHMIQFVTLAVVLLTTHEQSRKEAVSEADEAQLLGSVSQNGVLQPLGVKLEGQKYRVVWGHRRLKAAIAAGLTEVPCVVLDKDLKEHEWLALQLQENINRVDISQFDLWQGAVRLLESSPGMTQAELGKLLSMNPPSVTKLLSPSKCIPAWQEALKAGTVGVGDCYSASRLNPDEQMPLLIFKQGGATRDQAAAAAAAVLKRKSKPADDAVKLALVKLPLSSALSITVRGPDMTLSQLIDALGQAKEAAQKCLKDQLDIKTAVRVFADRSRTSA